MKEKYTIEFGFKSIPASVLWNYIYTPSGLSEWFADQVDVIDKRYIFTWGKSTQEATLLQMRMHLYTRFRWSDEPEDKSYFEFQIQQLDLTGNTTLAIVGFALPDEVEEEKELWQKQVSRLRQMTGVL